LHNDDDQFSRFDYLLSDTAGPEELQTTLSGLELHLADIVLIPINDNKNIQDGGGSHWTLLVWVKKSQQFIHLDSLKGSNNYQVSIATAKKLHPLLHSTT